MVISNRKLAQGHVEIVLSMVLFIGFILFLFVYLNPALKVKKGPDINRIEDRLIERVSSGVGKLSVIVNSANECYSLTDINTVYGDNFIEIADPITDPLEPRRYTIYYADFFSGAITCLGLPESFTLGVYTEENIVYYDRILELVNDYSNYGDLKESLGVGNFVFSFEDSNGRIDELSVERLIPGSVDVV